MSLALTMAALLAVAVLDFVTASYANDCKKAQRYSILSGIIALLVALIAFILAVVAF